MNSMITRMRSPIRAVLCALMLLPAEAIFMTPQTADAAVVVRRGPYGRTTVVRRPVARRGVVYYGARPRYYGARPYVGYRRPYYYGGPRRVARRTARRVSRRHGY